MKKTIKNAAQLVTVSQVEKIQTSPVEALGIIEDGALLIEGDKITWVGKTADLPSTKADVVIDASGQVVMPGLIDPHTHIIFAGSREKEFAARLQGQTYRDGAIVGGGIKSTVLSTRQASRQELYNLGYKRLDRMLRRGTTTIEAKSGYGLTTDAEIKILSTIRDLNDNHPIDIIPTFMGALDIPPEYQGRKNDYIDLLTKEMIPRVSEEKLAEFCGVFCDIDMFSLDESRRILEVGRQYDLQSRIHADAFCPFKAAELAAEIGVTAAAHLLLVSDHGIEMLAEHNVIAELLPGVPFFTAFVKYAPARRMLETGVNVALATGCNPGACMTESLPLTMTIACTQMRMTPAEALLGVTAQAARALRRFDQIGSLEVGKQADILLLDIPNYQYLPYHFGVNHVRRVIKKGKIVMERQT